MRKGDASLCAAVILYTARAAAYQMRLPAHTLLRSMCFDA